MNLPGAEQLAELGEHVLTALAQRWNPARVAGFSREAFALELEQLELKDDERRALEARWAHALKTIGVNVHVGELVESSEEARERLDQRRARRRERRVR